jgi:hypothetical protein
LDQARWEAARPLVIQCADDLALDGGAAALRAVRVLARLAAWALTEGLPLDVEVVLDPDTLKDFERGAAEPSNRGLAPFRVQDVAVGSVLPPRTER